MKLVVDANIVFSAIVKKGMTRNSLFKKRLKLYAPEKLKYELDKYRDILMDKTNMRESEFARFLDILDKRIIIVEESAMIPFMKHATAISPDAGDVHYFALALKLKCPIWSNDKQLKEQKRVRILSTEDILGII